MLPHAYALHYDAHWRCLRAFAVILRQHAAARLVWRYWRLCLAIIVRHYTDITRLRAIRLICRRAAYFRHCLPLRRHAL